MRIFFIGNVRFSRETLETVLQNTHVKVVGVATKSKSNVNADHTDISDIAVAHNIPWKYVKDINSTHIIAWISSLSPDIIFCFGWSALIRQELLDVPTKGVIGYHPAALPKNRGRHPIIWALALGLRNTASTFFKMDSGADSGDILSQTNVDITLEDDAQQLYEKLLGVAKKQISEFMPLLIEDKVNWTIQNERLTNSWRKRSVLDGAIDFRMNTLSIYNLVRALTKPYVGAHIVFQGKAVKIWRTKIGPNAEENQEPGKVLAIGKKNDLLIKTADSTIWLVQHEIHDLPAINSYIL